MDAKVPVPQLVHTVRPRADVKAPIPQLVHTERLVVLENVPVPQLVHTVLPVVEANVPEAQLVQKVLAVADANVPVAHLVLLIPLLQNDPVEQATHVQLEGYPPTAHEVGQAAAVVVATTVFGAQYLIELPKL